MELTDVQAVLELACFSLHLFAGRSTAETERVSFFIFTCSVHHHHFGVFPPEEGTRIRAVHAELSLPQA